MNQKPRHLIFNFIGPSHAGKSSLKLEVVRRLDHLRIIKSTTTRPPRTDETEKLVYMPHLSLTEFEEKKRRKEFMNCEFIFGNHYGYEKSVVDDCLVAHCGVLTSNESAVTKFRTAGYEVKLINVQPQDLEQEPSRVRERKAEDQARSLYPLEFDHVIPNSFRSGGFERSVLMAVDYIESILKTRGCHNSHTDPVLT